MHWFCSVIRLRSLSYNISSGTAPCFRTRTSEDYDDCLREIPSDVTNTVLVPDSAAWSQATLPVKQGGLGIRSAVIAPSAFLASSHASSELVSAILPSHLNSLPLPFIDEAAACWSQSHDSEPPVGTGACKQKSWDAPRASATAKQMMKIVLGCWRRPSRSLVHGSVLCLCLVWV